MKLPDSSILFTATEVQSAIDDLAAELQTHCHGHEWLVLCVMNGGLMFTGEVMKRLTLDMVLECVRVSRYGNETSGGELLWRYRPDVDFSGRNVLILDDIFDEGETMAALAEYCRQEGASTVLAAVLLDKQHDRKSTTFRPDFVGLSCEDHYVFGFGMDYEGYFRNLPEIRALAAIH